MCLFHNTDIGISWYQLISMWKIKSCTISGYQMPVKKSISDVTNQQDSVFISSLTTWSITGQDVTDSLISEDVVNPLAGRVLVRNKQQLKLYSFKVLNPTVTSATHSASIHPGRPLMYHWHCRDGQRVTRNTLKDFEENRDQWAVR